MNQVATQSDTRLATIEEKINRDVSSAITVGVGGITFQNAGEVMEFAKMMAVSGSAVPKHLRGQPGACLGIIDDAIRFRTSPYALARKSYFVNDNLAYEAQVIAGVINAFAPLKDRPNIVYEGEGQSRSCIVTATFKTGTEREYRSPPVGSIHPKNSPLWKSDPDQQLAYYSLRAFARRWCPEVILGIYDVEEMRFAEMRDVSPQPSIQERLAAAREETEEAREGFDQSFVTRETSAFAGEPDSSQSEDNSQSPDAPSSASDDSGGEAISSPAATDTADVADPAGADDMGEIETAPATLSDDDRDFLTRVFRTLKEAVGPDVDVLRRQAVIFKDDIAGRSDLVKAKAKTIREQLEQCCGDEPKTGTVAVGKYVASLIGVDEKDLIDG